MARGVVALTKAQMAAALQVTYRTITEMMRREEIRFFRIGGKHVRIRIEEALARMEKAEILKADSRSPDELPVTDIDIQEVPIEEVIRRIFARPDK